MIPNQAGRSGARGARRIVPLVLCGALVAACTQAPPVAPPAELARDIAPDADKILKGACDYLAKAPQFSCSAEVWEDIVLPGTNHKMQLSRTVDVRVRRPDHLRADANARQVRNYYYDGKMVTVYNPTDNLYGQVSAPNTLDTMIDYAGEIYNVEMPLQDLIVADPYAGFTKTVRLGRDLGMEVALGTPCHHLGFSQDVIDWQIWIEDGAKPLIRKLVITYKLEEGSPQFTALLTKWDMETAIPDTAFTFTIPAGAGKFDILPRAKEQGK